MDRGWIKTHRKLTENIFLMNDDNAYLVFTKLLLYVNSNGEYAAGRNKLGELLNINPRTLYGVLSRLEAQHMIRITSNKRYSIITICKWEEYQGKPNNRLALSSTMTQQSANNDSTMRQHLNKNKELRIKNKKPSKIDEDLAAKEQVAKSRVGGGYESAKNIVDKIKLRKAVA